MPTMSLRRGVLLILPLLWTQAAEAHGIAGNRYFAGTMTFDDPAVADELILPNFSYLGYPTQGSAIVENRINGAFARLLTPTLAFTIDSSWAHQGWPIGSTSGFDKTNIGLKYEAYRDNRHEALISVGLAWGVGHSGAAAIGADAPDTIQPGIFFGKGFGDLPDSLSWLRPFAITGALVDEVPIGTGGIALAPNLVTRRFDTVISPAVETLHWGFSIQYSTLYLTKRFDGGPPKDEPLNQLVPLVEFRFESPRGQATAASANPGFAYVAVTWQVAAEAIIPLNRAGGSGPGFRAQLLLFLDDLVPSLFGKPLISDHPARTQIAW
ncbi:hypothetical protein [Bradyrhizobium sp. ORS 111]|uniref:hypothetical protein n=1 Tax=Bradyrhizobium sp. ORS 111 TaxID=1685958 RepID=UPI00388F480B